MCFIDDQLIYSTTFQSPWRYVILNEDNLCLTGSSWFDDLTVILPGTVSTTPTTWGTVKALFR